MWSQCSRRSEEVAETDNHEQQEQGEDSGWGQVMQGRQ